MLPALAPLHTADRALARRAQPTGALQALPESQQTASMVPAVSQDTGRATMPLIVAGEVASVVAAMRTTVRFQRGTDGEANHLMDGLSQLRRMAFQEVRSRRAPPLPTGMTASRALQTPSEFTTLSFLQSPVLQPRLCSEEPLKCFSPFLDVILAENLSSLITATALRSVQKLLTVGIIDPALSGTAEVINEVASKLRSTKYVPASQEENDLMHARFMQVRHARACLAR